MKLGGAQQIERSLTDEIGSGRIGVGEKLPTRKALMSRFGVARATVDRAVQILVHRGLVETRRGAGSLVISRSARRRVGVFGSLAGVLGLPQKPGVETVLLNPSRWRKASAREKLSAFDGLLWYCPGSEEMKWARQLGDVLPQVVVNRTPSDLNHVSTDHAGALYTITQERLAAHADGLPVFLGLEETSEVIQLRQEGFVRACREQHVFYETLNLPAAFADKHAMLEERLGTRRDKPLLLVSAAMQNTGAVTRWVHDHGLRWGRDVLYSDFDNTLSADVFGITVTSFLQDYAGMLDLALSGLIELLDGARDRVQVLRPALRRMGET